MESATDGQCRNGFPLNGCECCGARCLTLQSFAMLHGTHRAALARGQPLASKEASVESAPHLDFLFEPSPSRLDVHVKRRLHCPFSCWERDVSNNSPAIHAIAMQRASRKQISLPPTGRLVQTAAWTGREELPSCTTQP